MNVRLSLPRMRQLYGRPVAVATLFTLEEDKKDGIVYVPKGEITLVEALTKQKKGELIIDNCDDVLTHLVLMLGVGA